MKTVEKEIAMLPLHTKNCSEIINIYNYYVSNTTVTYGTSPITAEQFAEYYHVEHEQTRAYILRVNQKNVGFAVLHPYNASKLAYRHTFEITIYLDSEECHKGYGSFAVHFLEEQAKLMDAVVIMAGVSADNTASCALFESCGYERCGHFRKVGCKFGKFLDLFYYQKVLKEDEN